MCSVSIADHTAELVRTDHTVSICFVVCGDYHAYSNLCFHVFCGSRRPFESLNLFVNKLGRIVLSNLIIFLKVNYHSLLI